MLKSVAPGLLEKAETQNNINSEKSVILAGGRNSQKP